MDKAKWQVAAQGPLASSTLVAGGRDNMKKSKTWRGSSSAPGSASGCRMTASGIAAVRARSAEQGM